MKKGKSLKEIAGIVNGEIRGDGNVEITGIRPLHEAGEGDLSFLANPRYRRGIETSNASAILVGAGVQTAKKNLLVVPDPYTALGILMRLFHPPAVQKPGVSPAAMI